MAEALRRQVEMAAMAPAERLRQVVQVGPVVRPG